MRRKLHTKVLIVPMGNLSVLNAVRNGKVVIAGLTRGKSVKAATTTSMFILTSKLSWKKPITNLMQTRHILNLNVKSVDHWDALVTESGEHRT